MLARITDWKTTLVGLAIAAVLIVALFARPGWGVGDVASLAGAVGAVMLGLLSHSQPPTEAKPEGGSK